MAISSLNGDFFSEGFQFIKNEANQLKVVPRLRNFTQVKIKRRISSNKKIIL
jgi:hypothetical protein